MTSLPANYVTLADLKERFLKDKEEEERKKNEEEERAQAEKEGAEKKKEEELRQQLKLKEEEEAKLPKREDVVAVRKFDRREIRPVVAFRREIRPAVVDRREYRPVVSDRRKVPPVVEQREIPILPIVNRSISECQSGETEEPEEEEKKPKKKYNQNKWKKNKKNVTAENVEESSEVECVAVFVVTESTETTEKANDGSRKTIRERRVEFRAKSKNVDQIEPKLKGMMINREIETGNDRLSIPNSKNAGMKDEAEQKVKENAATAEGRARSSRPNHRNVGIAKEIEPEGRELGKNGEIEKGNNRGWRPNGRYRVANEEIEPKVRDIEMNGETERMSDKLMGVNTDEGVQKVEHVSTKGATERGDRLKGPNRKGESELKLADSVMTGEIGGGKDMLWMPKNKSVGGKDETRPKVTESSVKAGIERGYGQSRRPSRFDYRKPWGNKKDQGFGMTWVKKGESSEYVAEVQS